MRVRQHVSPNIQKHNKLPSNKAAREIALESESEIRQDIHSATPGICLCLVAKFFQKLFTTSNPSERLSQPQHLSRPLQCAAVKLGDKQPCTNEALSENDFCAIHLNWRNRPGYHAICRELRYVPAAEPPRFQDENHAVQTQIQTAGTNWQEELVKTGDPPATHPVKQVFHRCFGKL